MKYMFASDIHGSALYCEKLISAYGAEKPDKLFLLGDLLYHGPRNPLPDGYEPKKVYELLNSISENIIAVRGNCDAEVDQMVLTFPIMADCALAQLGGATAYITHGHLEAPQGVKLVISGHTHIQRCEDENGVLYLNPGSVSMPKKDTKRAYMIYEDGMFLWKDLDGKTFMTKKI